MNAEASEFLFREYLRDNGFHFAENHVVDRGDVDFCVEKDGVVEPWNEPQDEFRESLNQTRPASVDRVRFGA